MQQTIENGRLTPAIVDALAEQAGDDAVALAQLARLLDHREDRARAHALAQRALVLAPGDDRIRRLVSQVLSREVPQWHFSIVQDEARNEAYDDAIRRAVRPGSRVLDIGTGSGLLALMAARAGAGEVVACEMNPALAATAAKVVELNGYSKIVRVIGRHSSDVRADDLGGRADVLVSETISNDVLGQDWLATLEDVVPRLCTGSVAVIPSKATVKVALAFDQERGRKRAGMVQGFDLEPLNSLAPDRYQIRSDSPRVTLRSEPATLFDFDFAHGGPFHPETASVEVEAEGPVNGIVQWISLQLDSETRYENSPGSSSCWALLFYPFAELSNEAGEGRRRFRIQGSHDRHRLTIWGTPLT